MLLDSFNQKDRVMNTIKTLIMTLGIALVSVASADAKAKEWGGFYGKFSFGYGSPDVVKENIPLEDDHINAFLKGFSATAREVAYDFRLGDNFAMGAEAGITFIFPDSKSNSSPFFLKGEFVPQISYINNDLKIFAGIGVGFANGYGYKGVPNAVQKAFDPNEKRWINLEASYGGYWLAELGFDYLLTSMWFVGAKYQYERTFTTAQKEVNGNKLSLYVQQHTFLATIGLKY